MVRCWETSGESLLGEYLLRVQLCRGLGLWDPCCGDFVVETVVLRRGMVTRPGSLRTGSCACLLFGLLAYHVTCMGGLDHDT